MSLAGFTRVPDLVAGNLNTSTSSNSIGNYHEDNEDDDDDEQNDIQSQQNPDWLVQNFIPPTNQLFFLLWNNWTQKHLRMFR